MNAPRERLDLIVDLATAACQEASAAIIRKTDLLRSPDDKLLLVGLCLTLIASKQRTIVKFIGDELDIDLTKLASELDEGEVEKFWKIRAEVAAGKRRARAL